MATVSYWSGSWAASGQDVEDELRPGDVHSWFAWGFNDGEYRSRESVVISFERISGEGPLHRRGWIPQSVDIGL